MSLSFKAAPPRYRESYANAMRGDFWKFQNQQVHENLSINAFNSMHVIFKFSPDLSEQVEADTVGVLYLGDLDSFFARRRRLQKMSCSMRLRLIKREGLSKRPKELQI